VFVPNSLGGMTCWALLSAKGRGEEIPILLLPWVGRGPSSTVGWNPSPGPFLIFPFLSLFLFLFSFDFCLKTLQINSNLIQDNFVSCKNFLSVINI
jgi:hypothetical protein